MQVENYQAAYRDIIPTSLEFTVAGAWDLLLEKYFPGRQFQRLTEGSQRSHPSAQRNDVTIQRLVNDRFQPFAIVKYKRPSPQEGSSAAWASAAGQLQDHMQSARRTDRNGNLIQPHDMFGIVAIGRYARFYMIPNDDSIFSSFQSQRVEYAGEPLEFSNDETMLHCLFTELADRIWAY